MSDKSLDPMNDEEIVGFEIDAEIIIERLNKGEKELDVIPIVGMAGQGKTTFARKLYHNDIIVHHFDVRAWCIISQTYNRQELLQEIFSQVISPTDKVDEVGDVADMLRKRLIGRRYLIVLDDMWDIKAWEDLRLSFPNGETGSRIIVTTRLEKVGKQVKHDTDPHSLPFLKHDESLKLLQKKVFEKEACPPKLQDVSLAVAKKCKGLPLVIILVAGIIKRKKTEESWWDEVNKSLLSHLGEAEGYSLSTMQLSYDNLPDSLKPCLLYMGMFPEDARIPVSKLISLWIAEGFVQNITTTTTTTTQYTPTRWGLGRSWCGLGRIISRRALPLPERAYRLLPIDPRQFVQNIEYEKSMEEAAEGYLMDLISSNVVMVEKRSYNGKAKYCQVHDVVLHFCLEKSREKNFMLAVKGNCSEFRPSHWKETRLSITVTDEISACALLAVEPFHQHLRSLITNDGGEYLQRNPFHQHLRSLITNDGGKYLQWNAFPQISKLGFLKVLDLSSHEVVPLSSITLHPLINLKYLAVRTKRFYFHPESHLRDLETLIVLNSSVALPPIFWKMEKLRHVEIDDFFFNKLEIKRGIFEESSKLENLRILRHFYYSPNDGECMERLIQRCPNIQNLTLTVVSFCPKLESLTRLQLLDIIFMGSRFSMTELHFPSNLKKLKLKGHRILSAVPSIAGLPNLEYLKLEDCEIGSEEWCLKDIKFNKLKFLKLVWLGITRLDDSEESFPMLERLVIKWCEKLEEIPPSFADIGTLKQIKLTGRRQHTLETSAVKLKEDIEEIEGCSRLKLIMDFWSSIIFATPHSEV